MSKDFVTTDIEKMLESEDRKIEVLMDIVQVLNQMTNVLMKIDERLMDRNVLLLDQKEPDLTHPERIYPEIDEPDEVVTVSTPDAKPRSARIQRLIEISEANNLPWIHEGKKYVFDNRA